MNNTHNTEWAADFSDTTARRVAALAEHLDIDPAVIEPCEYDSDTLIVSPRTEKRGTSPQKARDLVSLLRAALKASDLVDHALVTMGYDEIMARITEKAGDYLSVGLHDVANTLHFLINKSEDRSPGTDKHRAALREAWAGDQVQDRREDFRTDSGQYLVIDEDDANSRWNDALDSYLDDEGIVPGADSPYFNREAWKRDARMDGRGHTLSGYDGTEHNSGDWLIYRTN